MADNGSSKSAQKRGGTLTIPAKPQPIEIDPSRAALLIVDMQNDFGSEGGMFDREGIDLSQIRRVISPISQLSATARAVDIPIVYIKMAFRADLSDLGIVGSPNRERHLLCGVGQPTNSPDGRDSRFLIRDTWNTDIIAELAPQPEDIVVYKHRYSAFYQTELDAILLQRGIRYLIITGCTTSVCVESTLRDAFFRDYSCILLADCTAEPIGSTAEGHRLIPSENSSGGAGGSNFSATLLLVETLFGWVSDSKTVQTALESNRFPAGALSERRVSS